MKALGEQLRRLYCFVCHRPFWLRYVGALNDVRYCPRCRWDWFL